MSDSQHLSHTSPRILHTTAVPISYRVCAPSEFLSMLWTTPGRLSRSACEGAPLPAIVLNVGRGPRHDCPDRRPFQTYPWAYIWSDMHRSNVTLNRTPAAVRPGLATVDELSQSRTNEGLGKTSIALRRATEQTKHGITLCTSQLKGL